MLLGIGTDIIEISRLEKIIDNNKFMSTYYTENELAYISKKANRSETAAAIFCGKEAVAKAMGTGFSGFMPRDIEILHDDMGKPYVIFSGNAKNTADLCGITGIQISLSHCRDYASACAVAEGDEKQ